ncbi:MAG: AbrB/MazE/SpoVT family DNA-binding domain-containing protein [Pseudomonadota bacterium]|nr:AbrB/MazE/SpoVT family DNA-binding domain-containing protein [Pseudomonadota bacterium]
MTYARVSPKYQVVIPKDVRKAVGIKPGQRLMIYAKDNVIYLIPEVASAHLKGICRGMDVAGVRDEEERI